MNMVAYYIDDLVDAFYRAKHAFMAIDIRLGVSTSSYVHNLNALLTEISQFMMPALAQPGVNTANIFAPNQRQTWIYWLLEWYQQLEYEAMDAYAAGSDAAALEISIRGVIAVLKSIE